MSTVNRKELYRREGTVAGSPVGGYADIILLNLANYRSYNWGAAGKEARGNFLVVATGLEGSGTPNVDVFLRFRVHLKRSNGGTPTVATPDGTGPLSVDVDGNVLRIRQYVYFSQFASFVEMSGTLLDFTP